MAGERDLPGLSLKGYWTAGSDGYGDQVSGNFRTLSVVVFGQVLSRTTSLPGAPTDGDIYIIPAADADGNDIAARDSGAWVLYTPWEGQVVWVADEDAEYRWNGAAWERLDVVSSVAGLTGDVTAGALKTALGLASVGTFISLTDTPSSFGAAGQVPVVNSGATALEWATVSGYTTETAVDDIAAALTEGNNITITYNDAAGTITIDAASGAADTDELVAVSANDTNPGYLLGKLVAGANITLTENLDGGDETLTIAASGIAGDDKLVAVSANDTTPGYLNGKLVAGTGVTLTEGSDGGDETLTIDAATGSITVEDEGTSILAGATTLNFVGTAVTVTDAGSNQADITITPGGGSWVLLNSVDFSTNPGTEITATGIDSYTTIKIIFQKINAPTGDAVSFQLRLSTDGGSTYLDSSGDYVRADLDEDGVFSSETANFLFATSPGEQGATNLNGVATITMHALATAETCAEFVFRGSTLGGTFAGWKQGFGFTAATAVHNALRINAITDSASTGTIRIYGLT